MRVKNIKKGFTLAETLIAMAVLGIVAAITVPTLVQTTNKHMYVDGLKRATLMLKTATGQLMLNNSGTMINLVSADGDHNAYTDIYCSRLNCIKRCYSGTVNGNCFANGVKVLHGASFSGWIPVNTFNNYAGAILSNGMTIVFYAVKGSSCSQNLYTYNGTPNVGCGQIFVDINGLRSPNILGKDIFTFYTWRSGIVPVGIVGTNSYYLNAGGSSCSDTIQTNVANGSGCAGRVLTEGTMNY